MSQTTGQIEAEINAVIEAPTTSRWLKGALTDALHRDCIDCDPILGRA